MPQHSLQERSRQNASGCGREVIGDKLTIVYSNLPIIIHFFNMEARNSRVWSKVVDRIDRVEDKFWDSPNL